MSTFIPKEGQGRIFDNRPNKTEKAQPDYTGSMMVGGKHWRVVGWSNPPDERNRVGSVSLRAEPYEDYRARVDANRGSRKSSQPTRDETGMQTSTEDRTTAQPDAFDHDIPF